MLTRYALHRILHITLNVVVFNNQFTALACSERKFSAKSHFGHFRVIGLT